MTNYLEKLNHLDRQLNSPTVHQQVEEVNQIIVTVSAKKILAQAPQKLGLEPDEFENILEHFQYLNELDLEIKDDQNYKGELKPVVRKDEVKVFECKDLFRNVKDMQDTYIKVPKIIE